MCMERAACVAVAVTCLSTLAHADRLAPWPRNPNSWSSRSGRPTTVANIGQIRLNSSCSGWDQAKTVSITLITAAPVWFGNFSLDKDATEASGNYLDIQTFRSATNYYLDTSIAVYSPTTGNLVKSTKTGQALYDDNDGPGVTSQLSFGNRRERDADYVNLVYGEKFKGQDGGLTKGKTYQIAVAENGEVTSGGFGVNKPEMQFANNWNVVDYNNGVINRLPAAFTLRFRFCKKFVGTDDDEEGDDDDRKKKDKKKDKKNKKHKKDKKGHRVLERTWGI